MDVDVQTIINKLASVIGDLNVRIALLETQIETMMKVGEKDASVRPVGENHGDAPGKGND